MSRDRWREFAWALAVTAVYTLIAIAVTWPVAAKFSSAVGGFEGRDAFTHAWRLWWFKTALLEMHTSPADLRVLYAPGGIYHPVLLTTPYLGLVSAPIFSLLNPAAVYNLHLLLAFALTGLSTYLLCYELSGNRAAAFVGGLVFSFFPSRMAHAIAGHLTQITAYWPPLYALFLLRTFRRPSWKNGILAGVFLALSALTNLMHGAYFAVMLTVGIVAWQMAELKGAVLARKRIMALGAGLVVAGVILVPFFAPLLIGGRNEGLGYLSSRGTVEHSTDLLAFVLPSPYHPLLNRWGMVPTAAEEVFPNQRALEEGVAYLGLIPLALAGLAVARHWRDVRVWAILGTFAATLSLGPFLRVGGRLLQVTVDGWSSYLPLPYLVVKQVPIYSWGRTPNRLNDVTGVALAVLVTFGAGEALGRLGSRWLRVLAGAMCCALLLFEYGVMFPFPMAGERVPAYYSQMAAEGGGYAVLDIPGVAGHAVDTIMYYQAYHHHPIVGGHTTRHPAGEWEQADFISNLAQPNPGRDVVSHPSDRERLTWLAQASIGRVIVHKDLMIAVQRETVVAFLRDLLSEPIFEDAQIVVFAVPPAPGKVEERLFSLSSEGWHQVEQWGELPARWLGDNGGDGGALYVWQPTEETGQLRFTAYAFQQPRTVRVTVNDQLVGAVLAHSDWPEYVT
ncbi:MAG: hypothetical protein SVX38_09685, partial [Chloroflexota bacterium]|nr:hypothetical protein [Chloroflexota bacterium]